MSNLRVRSFRGLIPAEAHVAEVNCVPYDVINAEEARQLAAGKPNSLLHVDRAEIDLPKETDPYSAAVYEKAKENFLSLQKKNVLVREKTPVLYVYRQTMGSHVQTGIAAVCHVEDYDADRIKKHEKTRKDKEDDRTRLIDTLGATTGPVFLTHRDTPEINRLVNDVVKGKALFDITAPDGVRHEVWRVETPAALEAEFAKLPCTYIADGHHRAASAARVARLRRERNPKHDGTEPFNWFLAVLFPAPQLKILPYNRLVLDLKGLTPEEFLKKAGEIFTLKEGVSPEPTSARNVAMYLNKKWYGLSWNADPQADPVSSLDVSVLQNRLLAPVLGIDDPRTSKRIDFVGGARGTKELVRRVDSGETAVAFSMYPTTVQQMMDIADAGQIMPPKSTWFEPKLRSGFFIHTME